MHLQKAVAGYDVFARSLSIGAETMVMKFDPDQPMHARYSIAHDFLDAADGGRDGHDRPAGQRVLPVGVQLLRDADQGQSGLPDRLRQRVPGRRDHQLHYYFPWAMKALAKWSVFCTVTGRRPRYDTRHPPLFRDRRPRPTCATRRSSPPTGSWPTTISRPSATATSARRRLAHLDEVVLDWVDGPEFDRCLSTRFESTFPPHEHDEFIAHFRGLLGAWVKDESARLAEVAN